MIENILGNQNFFLEMIAQNEELLNDIRKINNYILDLNKKT